MRFVVLSPKHETLFETDGVELAFHYMRTRSEPLSRVVRVIDNVLIGYKCAPESAERTASALLSAVQLHASYVPSVRYVDGDPDLAVAVEESTSSLDIEDHVSEAPAA